MVLYPLEEILLSVLVGSLCRAEDFDEIEEVCTEIVDWLRQFLPFERGIAPEQTLRRTREPTMSSCKRKRLKAAIDPTFRAAVVAY